MRTRTAKRTRSSNQSGDTGSREPIDEVKKANLDAVNRAFVDGLRVGDSFTLTSGAETYALEGGSVMIGPISATITIRPDEKPDEAYVRSRVLIEALYQAEFEIKINAFKQRRRELCGD